jgi:hypothetical protein
VALIVAHNTLYGKNAGVYIPSLWPSPPNIFLPIKKKKKVVRSIQHVWTEVRFIQGYCWENRKRDHLEDLGVDGREIVECIFKKLVSRAWNGLIWLRRWKSVWLF